MAAPSGTSAPAVASAVRYWDVTQLLSEEPWTFQFFQAVRLLERILPDRSPIGRFVHPSKEIVRINVNSITAFPASQIQELRWETGAAPVLVVNFMGLFGPLGALPLYYSEMIRERLRAKAPTAAAFHVVLSGCVLKSSGAPGHPSDVFAQRACEVTSWTAKRLHYRLRSTSVSPP